MFDAPTPGYWKAELTLFVGYISSTVYLPADSYLYKIISNH